MIFRAGDDRVVDVGQTVAVGIEAPNWVPLPLKPVQAHGDEARACPAAPPGT